MARSIFSTRLAADRSSYPCLWGWGAGGRGFQLGGAELQEQKQKTTPRTKPRNQTRGWASPVPPHSVHERSPEAELQDDVDGLALGVFEPLDELDDVGVVQPRLDLDLVAELVHSRLVQPRDGQALHRELLGGLAVPDGVDGAAAAAAQLPRGRGVVHVLHRTGRPGALREELGDRRRHGLHVGLEPDGASDGDGAGDRGHTLRVGQAVGRTGL